MAEQKDLIPAALPAVPRPTQCWKCAVDRVAIENGYGQTLGFQCPCCHRFTVTGKPQPVKAPK